MHLNPYLSFEGQCEAAFQFYETALGGTGLDIKRYEGSPMIAHMPPEWSAKVLHARLNVGSVMLMGSDTSPDRYQKAQGIRLSLEASTPEEADRVFEALSEGATVEMPMQETFWAVRFGMLTDRFGTPWMVDCEKSS